MAGPQISTGRQREAATLKAEWERKRAARTQELRERFGAGFKGFDDLGEPIVEGREMPRSMRGPEFIRALERAHIATGDPVFDDALRAVRAYGLDQGGHRRVANETWGDGDAGYLTQVQYLVDFRHMSSRSAAEHVVSEFGVGGPSFEGTADRIRHKFDDWRKAKYPAADLDYEAGDLGYRIAVAPIEGVSLEALMKGLPTQGEDQPATTWWRRLFREGAVSIRYLGEK